MTFESMAPARMVRHLTPIIAILLVVIRLAMVQVSIAIKVIATTEFVAR